ncbi:glycosyl transferase [Virgibacillus halodenitrificans]|uniref:glycosyl transferase n=1 Tax=Virgibacillus halodenitrificans TaxID=1482 RepID=UPI0013683966|nr:glycosyl transferase [Virgibacillus halodenitrificans]MYL44275.1 glycosyl transferase [Virgibacillus halodenitrificans]
MSKQLSYFISGLIIILLSVPLGEKMVDIVYLDQNLTGEYASILNGFIHSFMLIGTLVFSIGLIELRKSTER